MRYQSGRMIEYAFRMGWDDGDTGEGSDHSGSADVLVGPETGPEGGAVVEAGGLESGGGSHHGDGGHPEPATEAKWEAHVLDPQPVEEELTPEMFIDGLRVLLGGRLYNLDEKTKENMKKFASDWAKKMFGEGFDGRREMDPGVIHTGGEDGRTEDQAPGGLRGGAEGGRGTPVR